MDHKAEEAISHPKPIIVILLGGKVTDFSCNAYEFCMFFLLQLGETSIHKHLVSGTKPVLHA